jgi:hypothetical protein
MIKRLAGWILASLAWSLYFGGLLGIYYLRTR